MWIAKIRNKHTDCVTTPKVVKHKIKVYATPGTTYSDNKYIYNTGILLMTGPEKNKKLFVRDLKRDKRVLKVEVNKDLIVLLERRPKQQQAYTAFRSPEIMCIQPIYCNPDDGLEYWEICSWDKKHIQRFLEEIAKVGKPQLISMERMKLQDMYFFHLMPHLTSKQKEALELAMQHGYYEVPRKIELKKLAKSMHITPQAFSEHLRKAEARLLPALTKSLR